MYTQQLIDAYKEHMNYVQYKQVAADLGISGQMITEIRKGRSFLKENQALMMADAIGEDEEVVLIGLAADKAKTPREQALWESIAKKFNGRGLQGISTACGGLMLWIGSPNEAIAKCALCILC
ncbi:antirepressor [Vibrio xuii]|nr:antirepressor [Vibrio xuii]